MRNYDFILKDRLYEGQDIDILVTRKQMGLIDCIVRENGLKKRNVSPFSNHAGYEKFILEDKKNLRLHFHIDGVTGNHVTYLDADRLLHNRVKDKWFWHVSKKGEKEIVYFHCLYDKKTIDKKYARVLGINEFSEREKEHKEDFLFINSPKIAWVYLSSFIWKLFHLSPVISLIGMDGTGKTTNITYLHEVLERNKIKHEIVYGGRGKNNILPIQSIKIKPSKITRFLSAPVFAFDLFLRYWVHIFHKRFIKDIVIVDRFSSDILLMKDVPMFFKKMLYCFMPKATKCIYLYNRPEVLAKRKEHPIEDLIRQEKLFEQVNHVLNPIKILSDVKEKTKADVLKAIMEVK
jgi:thymidylate kinase